ncbi:hypothetical protein GC177_07050 [bacterium]|nr:hypothetical protein [bacterium]
MSPTQGYNAYRFARATTSKTRQVVMLYETALAELLKARQAMEKNDIEARWNHSDKAMQIMLGLQQALDFDQGGEVSELLYDFYTGVTNNIHRMQRYNNLKACDHAMTKLKDMLQSWKNIDQQQHEVDAAASAVVPKEDPASRMPNEAVTISA